MKGIKAYYDVVVIGAGHAGCEAALASARVGAKTLLLTMHCDHIAQMSCNPAVGGIAKGQVTREIDALGGAQAIVADSAAIQYRMLNRTKGPAVWSPRAQCDKVCFQRAMKLLIERAPNLDIKQATALDFVLKSGKISGVQTNFHDVFYAKSFVISTGTFLAGKLHYGTLNFPGGRAGDSASVQLAKSLKEKLKLRIGRLKTGTPPRILAKSIDFDRLQKQPSEEPDEPFAFFEADIELPRTTRQDLPCYLVYSTKRTAEIVRRNIDKSPLYQGIIEGIGTRYCPSFEDKIMRFPHHEKHLLFLEPEGEYTDEYYLNGISSSLPPEVQLQMIHSLPGFENALLSRYAYAIEYDFVFPDQIQRSLQVKIYPNLFLAGQINGTSGYEEAGGQGVIAGLNAARYSENLPPVELGRNQGYIGVMIDDLVTKEIVEPYRLFTSRAEYRLTLRQDNADLRLCEFAYEHNLLPYRKYKSFQEYRRLLETARKMAMTISYNEKPLWNILKTFKGKAYFDADINIFKLLKLDAENRLHKRVFRQLVIEAHYEGYLKREADSIERLSKLETWRIPENFDYKSIKGLRNESLMKLQNIKPTTLSQASRIDGVTPSEITLLQVHLKRFRNA